MRGGMRGDDDNVEEDASRDKPHSPEARISNLEAGGGVEGGDDHGMEEETSRANALLAGKRNIEFKIRWRMQTTMTEEER